MRRVAVMGGACVVHLDSPFDAAFGRALRRTILRTITAIDSIEPWAARV